MAKILGVGIATLDIINYTCEYPAEDSEMRATKQKIVRGGNVTNTLTVLSQLKHECFWAGTLANEPDAEIIKNDLIKYSINTEYVQVQSQGKVPTSYIVLNQINGSRSIVHYRDLAELTFEDFKKIPLEQFDWLHFEARNIEQTILMLQYLKEHHKNIPCSIEFEKNRPGINQLYPYSDTLIFSKNYCIKTSGNNPEKFIQEMHNKYSNSTIILAWGDKGSYGFSKSNEIIFSPAILQNNIVDTIGAGDTFNAAIINSLIDNNSLKDTLYNANKLAAYKISVPSFDISGYDR